VEQHFKKSNKDLVVLSCTAPDHTVARLSRLPSFLPSRSSPWCTVKWFSSIWNLEHKGHLSFWLFNTLLSACCLPLQFLLLCVPFHVICRFLSIPRNFFFLPRTKYIYIYIYFFFIFFLFDETGTKPTCLLR